MNKVKKSLSIIAFLALLSFCVFAVSEIFSYPSTYLRLSVLSFNEEAEDKVDTIILGTSVASYGFFPTVAFNEYGISAYNFGSDIQSASSIQGLLDYAKSKQNIKYVIIDVHGFRKNMITTSLTNENSMRRVYGSLPIGKDRYKIVKSYSEYLKKAYEYYGYSKDEISIDSNNIDLYIPFVKYHNRWTTGLKKSDFVDNPGKYKGGFSLSYTFKTSDCSKYTNVWTGKETELDEFQLSLIDELLEYLDNQDFKVLFINLPSFRSEEEEGECLSMMNYIEERGFNTLNLANLDSLEKMDINLKTDFLNKGHVNSKGAIKCTRYICEYIKELFSEDYVDHRGEAGYESWDKAIDNYSVFLKNGWKDATKEDFIYKRKY